MEEIIKRLDKKLKILNYKYIDETLVITITRINQIYVLVVEKNQIMFTQNMSEQ